MIKCNRGIAEVRQAVSALGDRAVTVKLNLGRNRCVSFPAKVSGVYPALFTVLPESAFNGKTAYSYSEVVCGRVKLKLRSSPKAPQ